MPLASIVTCVHVLMPTYTHMHIFKNKIKCFRKKAVSILFTSNIVLS